MLHERCIAVRWQWWHDACDKFAKSELKKIANWEGLLLGWRPSLLGWRPLLLVTQENSVLLDDLVQKVPDREHRLAF